MSLAKWENLASWISVAVMIAAAVPLLIGASLRQGPREVLTRVVQQWSTAAAGRTVIWLIVLPAMSVLINIGMMTHRKAHGFPGIPRPLIHDEFSYLLAADTFAHGRVTNPTPPLPEHFETPQELMRPTYMSKYPPGQGIALAIGQVTTGEPIVGVWLSTAAACAAIYWMMLAFVSPRWALVGGIVALLCPELSDWSQVYWGGSVAVLGGALLVGAWGRMMRSPGIAVSTVLGLSLVILANTRPFEGLLLTVFLLFGHAARDAVYRLNAPRAGWPNPQFAPRAIVPSALILLTLLAGMAWYNFRITGSALRMPFTEYAAQYDVYPKFWFLPKRPVPVYQNESLKWVALDFEKGEYDALRTFTGCVTISLARLRDLILWQAKPIVLLIPLVVGLFVYGDSRLRWVRVAVGLSMVVLLSESFLLPHYAAPMLPAVLLLTIAGWRKIYCASRHGRAVAASIAVGFLVGAIMILARPVSQDSMITGHAALSESDALRAGHHLVLVRYSPSYSFNNEYVFNDADIAASRIVWARSLGPVADHQLIAQFSGRTVWRLTVGQGLNLDPYAP